MHPVLNNTGHGITTLRPRTPNLTLGGGVGRREAAVEHVRTGACAQEQLVQLRQSLVATSTAAAEEQAMLIALEGASPPVLARPAAAADETRVCLARHSSHAAERVAIPSWPRDQAAAATAPVCEDLVEQARVERALISLRARKASGELGGAQFASYVMLVKQGNQEPPARAVAPVMSALLSAQKKATKQAPRTKEEAWADAEPL
jgi:hypothetical protein